MGLHGKIFIEFFFNVRLSRSDNITPEMHLVTKNEYVKLSLNRLEWNGVRLRPPGAIQFRIVSQTGEDSLDFNRY